MQDESYPTINNQELLVFRKLLKTIRKEAGLSQIQLAERLQKHQSFVSKFESGERRLDVIELRQICIALGMTLPDFVVRLEKEITPTRK